MTALSFVDLERKWDTENTYSKITFSAGPEVIFLRLLKEKNEKFFRFTDRCLKRQTLGET